MAVPKRKVSPSRRGKRRGGGFLSSNEKERNILAANILYIEKALLPENFPEKELANKKSKFTCKIVSVKKLISSKVIKLKIF